MRSLRSEFLLGLFSSALAVPLALAQDPPAPAPPSEPKPLPALEDKQAGEQINEFRRLYLRSADLGRRIEAVKKIATHRNERFAAELQKVTLADPNPIVRAEAAKALGRQDGPKGKAATLTCMKNLKGEEQQVVLLALLDSVLLENYDPAWFETLVSLFEEKSTPAAVQQRIVRILGKGKDKRAFRLLVENLNEPIPKNPDDPNNPPAAYWENLWKRWDVWRLDVAKALKELTGVEFKEKKYYVEWVTTEGKKLGFKY